MSTQQPDMLPEHEHRGGEDQQPERLFSADTPPVEAIVQRFWETVRKSADVIVTLRQENTMISAQNAALRRSEKDLQQRMEDLLARIAVLDVPSGTVVENASDAVMLAEMRKSIDRTEDELKSVREANELVNAELQSMQESLTASEHRIVEAQEHLQDNSSLSEQLTAVKAELKARTKHFHEIQDSFQNAQDHRLGREALEMRLQELEQKSGLNDETALRIAELEEEVADLRQQLNRALAIVQMYRAAGLRHVEDPDLKDQMPLFGIQPASVPQGADVAKPTPETTYLTDAEIKILAERLDKVADQVAQLLGIS